MQVRHRCIGERWSCWCGHDHMRVPPGCSLCTQPRALLQPPSNRPVDAERAALMCRTSFACNTLTRTRATRMKLFSIKQMCYLRVPHGAQTAGRVVQCCLSLLVAGLPWLVPAAQEHQMLIPHNMCHRLKSVCCRRMRSGFSRVRPEQPGARVRY